MVKFFLSMQVEHLSVVYVKTTIFNDLQSPLWRSFRVVIALRSHSHHGASQREHKFANMIDEMSFSYRPGCLC